MSTLKMKAESFSKTLTPIYKIAQGIAVQIFTAVGTTNIVL
jgi:hypothetical protein